MADAAAKAAVEPYRLEEREEARLKAAETMVHKALAKLGQVTAAASDLRIEVWEDGAMTVQRIRDSEAVAAEGGQVRKRRTAEAAEGHGDGGQPAGEVAAEAAGGQEEGHGPVRRRLRKKARVEVGDANGEDGRAAPVVVGAAADTAPADGWVSGPRAPRADTAAWADGAGRRQKRRRRSTVAVEKDLEREQMAFWWAKKEAEYEAGAIVGWDGDGG